MQIELTKKQKRHISVFNFIVPFLIGMAVDLYVPSLPHIAADYHASKSLVQLTIGLYMLGYGGGQFVLGVLTDYFGRRKIFLLGTLFFTIVSFIAAFSPNIYVLNLCRLFQGIGIAGMGVTRRALIVDCFSGLELTKAMTVIATSWSLGPIIGPYIGGYLQHYFNWRADFYFFGFYGLFVFVMTYGTLPETNLHWEKLKIKTITRSLKIIISSSAFVMSSVLLSLLYAMIVIFNTIAPFLIQNTLKYSVIAYGRVALFIGFGYFLGNLCNRQLIRYFHSLSIATVGLVLALMMIIVMFILAMIVSLNLYVVIIPVFFVFLFVGLVFPNVTARNLELFPKLAGTTGALFGMFVAGGVFLMTIFASTLKTNTQMPMTIAYLVMILICVGLFYGCKDKLK